MYSIYYQCKLSLSLSFVCYDWFLFNSLVYILPYILGPLQVLYMSFYMFWYLFKSGIYATIYFYVFSKSCIYATYVLVSFLSPLYMLQYVLVSLQVLYICYHVFWHLFKSCIYANICSGFSSSLVYMLTYVLVSFLDKSCLYATIYIYIYMCHMFWYLFKSFTCATLYMS